MAATFSDTVPYDYPAWLVVLCIVIALSFGPRLVRGRRSLYDEEIEGKVDPAGRATGATRRYRLLARQPHLANVEAFCTYAGLRSQEEDWFDDQEEEFLLATRRDRLSFILHDSLKRTWRQVLLMCMWSIILCWYVRFALEYAEDLDALRPQTVFLNLKAAARLHDILLVITGSMLALQVLSRLAWLRSITELVGSIRRPIETIAWLVGSSAPIQRDDLQRVFWALHRYLNVVHVLIYRGLPTDLESITEVELYHANLLMKEEIDTFKQSSAQDLESVVHVWIFQILTQLIEVEVLDPGLERELLSAMTAICKGSSQLAHELEKKVPPSFVQLGTLAVRGLCILTPPAIITALLEDRRGERDGVILMSARLWDPFQRANNLMNLRTQAASLYVLPVIGTALVVFVVNNLWTFTTQVGSPLKRRMNHIDLDKVLTDTEEVTLGHLKQNAAALPQLAHCSHAYDPGVYTPDPFAGETPNESILTTHFRNRGWRAQLEKDALKHNREKELERMREEMEQDHSQVDGSSDTETDGSSVSGSGANSESGDGSAASDAQDDVEEVIGEIVPDRPSRGPVAKVSFCERTLRQLDLAVDQQVASLRRAIAAAAASGSVQSLSVDAKRLQAGGEVQKLLRQLTQVVEMNASNREKLAEAVLKVRAEREEAGGAKTKFGPRPRSNSVDSIGIAAVVPLAPRGDNKPTHAPRPRRKPKAKAAPPERPVLRLVPGHHVEVLRSDGVWSHAKITRVMADGAITVMITESRKLKNLPPKLVKKFVRSIPQSASYQPSEIEVRSRLNSHSSAASSEMMYR